MSWRTFLVRSKGGLHDCPDRQEFKYRLHSYILGYNEGILSENGNILPDDTLDLEGLHYPLTGKFLSALKKKICLAPLPEEIELEDMAYDELENLARYICHKLSARVPGTQFIPDEDNTYTWVLPKPTREMMEHMTTLDLIFIEFNGTTVNACRNYLK